MSKQTRIEELRRVLSHLDTLWDKGEDCIHPDTREDVPNDLYDDWVRELFQLSPQEPRFTSRPSDSQVKIKGQKMIHDPPMVSINKASHEDLERQKEMLFKWLGDTSADGPAYTLDDRDYSGAPVRYAKDRYYQQYKLDGTAVSIKYEKGKLVQAGLRPRGGIEGQDVTEQIRQVQGVPTRLSKPLSLLVRGEIICKWSDFKKVQAALKKAGEKLRANPRNHAAGAIQNEEVAKVKAARLSFIAYGIEGHDNPPYETEIERAKWCNKVLGVLYIQTRPFNFYDLEKMEEGRKELDYMVDGIVLGVDNLEDQEQLGRHGDPRTGNPKGKIAWKFREEVKSAKVAEIVVDVGRTGKLTPVAVFTKSVRLAETDVIRATLHNFGFVKRHGVCVGTEIKVMKAGAIIPKVIDVVGGKGRPDIPSFCPACDGKTKLEKGGEITEHGKKVDSWELVCHNPSCPGKLGSGLQYYLTTFGVLGLGASRIDALVGKGGVKTFADFYRLDIGDAVACGLSERQALLAVSAIHMVANPDKEKDNDKLRKKLSKARANKKKIPAWKLFACLGIPTAGNSAGKALVEHFGNFDGIRKASESALSQVEGVGDKTASLVCSWMSDHKAELDDLLQYVEPESPKTGPLTGTTFVLSGTLEGGKDYWKGRIEDLGGNVGGSVGRKTNYLVAGAGSGSKTDKANELGVPIIDEKKLEGLLK